MLLAGGVYYTVQFIHQYGEIYSTWQAWAAPNYNYSTYSFLIVVYLLDVCTPLVMLLSGRAVFRAGKLQWYLAVMLAILLVLSGLVGKLILAVGIGIYLYNRWFHSKLA